MLHDFIVSRRHFPTERAYAGKRLLGLGVGPHGRNVGGILPRTKRIEERGI
jgi:hypothetical protein